MNLDKFQTRDSFARMVVEAFNETRSGLADILGFHSRDTGLGNGCYPPFLCPSSVNKLRSEET